MSRAALFLCLAAPLAAQNPADLFEKAPPDVDQALRERIHKFYQAHVDAKFREAYDYVAEDTRDFFFETNKPRYLSFQIDRINYSDNFTKATAIVIGERRIMMPGFAEKPMKVPEASLWKLENGKWCWYVDQSKGRMTPFGPMKASTGVPSTPGTGSLPAMLPDLSLLQGKVKADKSAVQLPAGATERVTLSNQMPGAVSLALEYHKVPGFEAALDKTDLKSGEQAVVTLSSTQKQDPPKGMVVTVRAQPINQAIPIQVLLQ